MINTIVIGAGPAGMMAAITIAKSKKQVILLEKNEKLGKKLYITGKGRCNITNDSDVENHLNQQVNNKKFLYSALYTFDSSATQRFFENEGLVLKVERGNRVFPKSDKSNDVIKAFNKALNQYQVDIRLNTKVTSIIVNDGCVQGVVLQNGDEIHCEHVIIATGGYSYQMTGSNGDGYKFAKENGHKIIEPVAGLVPIETLEQDILELQGLALKNVELTLTKNQKSKEKVLYKELGEMLFTHFGISGPLVLSASSHIPRQVSFQDLHVYIDMKPGLTLEQLDKRILRDFAKYQRKAFKNSLGDLVPSKMIPIIIKRLNIDENKTVDQISKEERLALVLLLKAFSLNIKNRRSLNEAIITQGGVDVKDINPHTMESNLIENLYFVGEVLDIDALTGGYNLQLAYSTGFLAGVSIVDK